MPPPIARCFTAPPRGPAKLVLVHGATGGVGLAAVQIAHAHGITVIGTGGSDRGLATVRDSGADFVFNHSTPGYLDDIMRATGGRGVDVILEMAAHVNLDKDLGLLATRGRVVVIGNRGRVEIDARQAMGRDASILGMTLFNISDPDMASINAYMVARPRQRHAEAGRRPRVPARRRREGAGSRDGGRRTRKNRPRSLKGGWTWPKPSIGRRGVRSGGAAASPWRCCWSPSP